MPVFLALAAVGWADGQLDEEEAEAIMRTALEENLDMDEIDAIEAAVAEPLDLKDVDLSALSDADKLFVFAVGSWISTVDGQVDAAERLTLDRLADTLRLSESMRGVARSVTAQLKVDGSAKPGSFFSLRKLRQLITEALGR
jgi:uncharacterized membrane protein YebE (DUF533 family)